MGQISTSAFTTYDPSQASTITPGPLALYTVSVGSIAPTQLNEGYTEVGKKASGYDLLTASQLPANLVTSIEPVVIGPGGKLYLTDGHHTFTALDDSIYGSSNPTVYVNVIANYANLTTSQFFTTMQQQNLLLPLDNGVPQTVNTATGAPIPSALTALTNDPYRGLEYAILKNKSSKLFTTTANITGAVGASTPGTDKMTGFYEDFLNAAAYRGANSGLGLPYLSPGDVALATQWNLNAASATTLPNVSGTVKAAQLPGFILGQNLVEGAGTLPSTITNTTLAGGALAGDGSFTGITAINAGTAANPITIGTPNTGFVMQLGADGGKTVTLNGTNSYTGGTSILAGTLIAASDAALGAAPAGTIDPANVKASVQAANGIVFNSLSEGAGTLQLGTTAGNGTGTFATSRAIAVGSEAATINLNGYLTTLGGALYSLGTNGVGLGNATGFSDITFDDTSANKGVVTLSTASPYFYGNVVVGNANKPTVRVTSDAALGATAGSGAPAAEIGQIDLNGGTLQAGASFAAADRNLFLGSNSTFDANGFTTSWGTLSDTQRVLTIANSGATPGAASFASFTIAATATLALTNSEATTFTGGVLRTGAATLILQPTAGALGGSEMVRSAGASATNVNGIVPAWIVTNNGTAAGPYDFVTYGANGYAAATYGATALSSTTGTAAVSLSTSQTATGNLAAYALNTDGKTLTLAGNTLTIGDGTAADAAGLILAAGSAISGGTLAFGGSEGVITTSGTTAAIGAQITGSDGLTFAGAGTVAINAAASVLGAVTVDSGTVTLGAANVFATDVAGVTLLDTKSTPAAAKLAVTANNTLATLNSAGNNSTVSIANATLTIGDSTNQSSTLSSAITGTGTAVLVKAGSGLLDLSAAKVSGIAAVVATGGALRVAVGTSGSVNYALSGGADLQFAQNGGGQYSGAISGAGTLHLIGGTLQLTGTANTYTGGTIVETGSTMDLTTANLTSGSQNITNAGGFVVFDQATNGTFTGVISDGRELGTGPMLAGTFDKDDSSGGNTGNVTMAAAQAYTGTTSVEAGTLTLGVANAIATSSGVTLGRVGGGATATLALGANQSVASLAANASNTTTVTLNGFALTVNQASGTTSSFGGAIVNGTVAGTLVKAGAGTLKLSGADTYTGGTALNTGTLELATQTAAGTGAITFGMGAQTLRLDATPVAGTATTFADTLASLSLGDTLDIRGLTAAGTTATYNAGVLIVANGMTSESFTLTNPGATSFYVTDDGAGSALINVGTPPSAGGGGSPVSTTPTSGPDSLTGSQGDDTVAGGTGDDTINGVAGNDFILGNQGNDLITVGDGMNTVAGGMDNDRITAGNGANLLYGDEGSDTISAGNGANTILGGTGNAMLDANDGADSISVGSGNDLILGNGGDDTIATGAGRNTVFGGMGNDLVTTAGSGSDLLYGDEGSDTIHAGDGNNTILGGTGSSASDSLDGADLITAGQGDDLILGNGGDDTVAAGAGSDTVVGGYGNDVLLGNQGNDIVLGNQGDDVIYGGFGDDTLVGGMGDDTLIGGQGNDVLYGDEGANRFVFNPGETGFASNVATGDTVADFKAGTDALHFAAGPAGTAADFGAASTSSTSFAQIQALAQTLLNGGDTYAFVGSGTDGYLFTTAGNGGGTGIEDVVRLTGVKQMQAGDIV